MGDRFRQVLLPFLVLLIASSLVWPVAADTVGAPTTALGVDVGFYTGPISTDVWQRARQFGQSFVIAQAWGGRSRNEFAQSQLAGARSAGMRTAAYILLNYDDKVCPTFAQPVREGSGWRPLAGSPGTCSTGQRGRERGVCRHRCRMVHGWPPSVRS